MNPDADFDVIGKYLTHHQKAKYIDVLVKCHHKPRKLLRERELALRLGHSKYILQPIDSAFVATKKNNVPGVSQDHHIMVYEKAEGNFDSLKSFIHESGCVKSVNPQLMRQAVKGIIRGVRFLHNNGYLYGEGLTEDAVRYTLVNRKEIHIKMTNLGYARRHKAKKDVHEFKEEVQKLAKIISTLVPHLDMFRTSGNCNMLRQLLIAMCQENLANVPCLELVNSSLFMLNGIKRSQFVCNASDTLRTDRFFVDAAMGALNLNFSAGWKNQIPEWASKYIDRHFPATAEKYAKLKKDTHTVLTVDFKENMTSIHVDLHKDVSLLSEQARNLLATFRLKYIVADVAFELSPRYDVGIPECCRYVRNLTNHPRQVCPNTAHVTKAFDAALFIDDVMEKVALFGAELGTLIYAVNHDKILGTQNLTGDLNIIAKQGGGCLFSDQARLFRETQTTARLNEFRREVLRKIEEVRRTKAEDNLLDDGSWPAVRTYPNIMKHLHEIVIFDKDYVDDWTSSSSGEYESAEEDDKDGATGGDGLSNVAQDSMVIQETYKHTIGFQQE